LDGPAFYFPAPDYPTFVAIPVPGLRPQLRQYYCPNFDHAKFFSITQARKSRPVHGVFVAAVLATALAPDWGEHAAIRPKDRRIQRRGCRREKE
jgi:hypothetical protein